jgi:hypothetical protein
MMRLFKREEVLMRRLIAFTAFTFLLASPADGSRSKPKTALGSKYFPAGAFGRGNPAGDFTANWFAGQLAALKEEPLKDGVPTGETVYRFLYLPTFSHPISVRVTIHANGSATTETRTATGAGGYDPGKLAVQKSQELSAADTQRILDLLPKPDFWVEPTEVDSRGCDGAEWILEGAAAGKYHVVDRWEGGSLRPLGEYLLRQFGPAGSKSMQF